MSPRKKSKAPKRNTEDWQSMYAGLKAVYKISERELKSARDRGDKAQALAQELREAYDKLRAEVEQLIGFKRYVHSRLDKAGVPIDPEPAENAKHGCRVEGRLNWLMHELSTARSEETRLDGVQKRLSAQVDKLETSESRLIREARHELEYVHGFVLQHRHDHAGAQILQRLNRAIDLLKPPNIIATDPSITPEQAKRDSDRDSAAMLAEEFAVSPAINAPTLIAELQEKISQLRAPGSVVLSANEVALVRGAILRLSNLPEDQRSCLRCPGNGELCPGHAALAVLDNAKAVT